MDGRSENLNFERISSAVAPENHDILSHSVDERIVALQSLNRSTIPGRTPFNLQRKILGINYCVDLALKNESENIDEKPFEFINEEARLMVADMVGKVLKRWEISLYRNGQNGILTASAKNNNQLIYSTAEQVMEILDPNLTSFDYRKEQDRKKAVDLISSRNSMYIQDFFKPHYIHSLVENHHLDETLANKYKGVFTSAVKKRIITHTINNPDRAVSRIINNLEEVLTDDNIASVVGWDVEKVSSIFTLPVKKHFAVININNPLKGCLKWVQGSRTMSAQLKPRKSRKSRKAA